MKLRVETPKKTMIKVEDPGGKKPLTYEQINQWSDFAEANPGVDLQTLWKGFSSKYPNSGIDYGVLVSDLDKLRMQNQRLAGTRSIDLAKTTHTGYSFPKMMVDGKVAGRVNADLKTQMSGVQSGRIRSKSIPADATEYWFDPKDNEVKYVDPKSGDVMYAEIGALNDPRMKKSKEQQDKDVQARNILLSNPTSSILKVK